MRVLPPNRRIEADYHEYDTKIFDFTKEGNAAYRFHPPNLPPANSLLQLAEFDGKSKYLDNAQRRWTAIVHHSAWLQHWRALAARPWREQVRFVAVSQPHAGDFLNAIPMRKEFRIPSHIMRLSVQRRLGLPITAAAALGEAAKTSKGRVLDRHGDAAVNDGRAGHAGRHDTVLKKLVAVMREVWGNIVEKEPRNCGPYSTYIPDIVGLGLALIGRSEAHRPDEQRRQQLGHARRQGGLRQHRARRARQDVRPRRARAGLDAQLQPEGRHGARRAEHGRLRLRHRQGPRRAAAACSSRPTAASAPTSTASSARRRTRRPTR